MRFDWPMCTAGVLRRAGMSGKSVSQPLIRLTNDSEGQRNIITCQQCSGFLPRSLNETDARSQPIGRITSNQIQSFNHSRSADGWNTKTCNDDPSNTILVNQPGAEQQTRDLNRSLLKPLKGQPFHIVPYSRLESA
jgi:hypothetical protein